MYPAAGPQGQFARAVRLAERFAAEWVGEISLCRSNVTMGHKKQHSNTSTGGGERPLLYSFLLAASCSDYKFSIRKQLDMRPTSEMELERPLVKAVHVELTGATGGQPSSEGRNLTPQPPKTARDKTQAQMTLRRFVSLSFTRPLDFIRPLFPSPGLVRSIALLLFQFIYFSLFLLLAAVARPLLGP